MHGLGRRCNVRPRSRGGPHCLCAARRRGLLDLPTGRGFASAAVAAWAAALRERGRLPLYSTSWENLASQGVARKLGMVAYGEDWEIE